MKQELHKSHLQLYTYTIPIATRLWVYYLYSNITSSSSCPVTSLDSTPILNKMLYMLAVLINLVSNICTQIRLKWIHGNAYKIWLSASSDKRVKNSFYIESAKNKWEKEMCFLEMGQRSVWNCSPDLWDKSRPLRGCLSQALSLSCRKFVFKRFIYSNFLTCWNLNKKYSI